MRSVIFSMMTLLSSGQALAVSAAIALNSQNCRSGYAYSYDSLVSAKNAALNNCGEGCEVVGAIDKPGFLALATGEKCTRGVSKIQNTQEGATSEAIQRCREAHGRDCDWRVWVGSI